MNRRTLGFLALCFVIIIVTVGKYIPVVKGFQNDQDSIQFLEGGHIPDTPDSTIKNIKP